MDLTLDCKQMISMRPIQFIETVQMCRNPTLSTTGICWDVKTHFNWFDKRAKMTEDKGKPQQMLGHKLKNLLEAQESVWINKTLAKVRLDSDNDNARVYSMICEVKQALVKDPSLRVGR